MPLEPDAHAINEVVVANDSDDASVEQLRGGYAAYLSLGVPRPMRCEISDVMLGDFECVLVEPPEPSSGLLVWFHGGGYVIGAARLAIAELDGICATSGFRALSVEYRLAPEHPLPAAQHDAIAATRLAIEQASRFGADPSKVAVGGDSAGGGLAAVAAQHVEGLLAQILVYPAADIDSDIAAMPHPEGYVLSHSKLAFFEANAPSELERSDPLLSPMRASDEVVAASPPALVVIAEHDPIRDIGRAYAARLASLGVEVEVDEHPGQMHTFFSLPALIEGARIANETAGRFLAARTD